MGHQKNISPRNCEDIYNQTIKWIDKWWEHKKTALKRKCIESGIDKQSFMDYMIPNTFYNDKKWEDLETDLRKLCKMDNYKEIITTIRLCTENDIGSNKINFGQWLLNLLEDKEEFNAKMNKLKSYIIGQDINASKLNEQRIKRKDFATSCDECDIPRGVSTKLHKELIKTTATLLIKTNYDVFDFMHKYL